MATTKKTTDVAVETKTEAAVAEEKVTAKKTTAKKTAEKKETTKKAPAKKTTKKAALTSEMHIQFACKSYSQEDLMNIAKDVWTYDLQQDADKLTSVELYVKPEESMVYYVMNGEFSGSFYI